MSSFCCETASGVYQGDETTCDSLNCAAGGEEACKIAITDTANDWIPEGRAPGSNNDDPGNSLSFTATVTAGGPRKIRFILEDVTSYKGVAMNLGAETTKDLKFVQTQTVNPATSFDAPPQDGQTITSKEKVNDATVTVTSFDWAAYGKVKACCLKADDSDCETHTELKLIPKDSNGNKIADAANQDNGPGNSKAADDDNDDTPQGDGKKGDLLTRLEEYRGFAVNGAHQRTNKEKKTAFVRNDSTYDTTDGNGSTISLFAKTELDVQNIKVNEEGTKRQINFNDGSNKQRAILVDNQNLSDAWGETKGPDTGFRPSNYVYCSIYKSLFNRTLKLELPMTKTSSDLIYNGRDDVDPRDPWWANGRVKIEDEIISYTTGEQPSLRQSDVETGEVKVPADSKNIPLKKLPDSGYKHIRIGDEIIKVGRVHDEASSKLDGAVAAGDNVVKIKGGYLNAPAGHVIIIKIEDEWMSYNGVDTTGGMVKLTGVSRGLFGTTAAAHANGERTKTPRQCSGCDRGLFGTTAEEIPTKRKIIPVGVLKGLTRGAANTNAAAHASGTTFNYFSNKDDAVRMTTAHEMGHAVGMNHADNRLEIMYKSLLRGAYLGGQNTGVWNDYSAPSKAEINAN